MPDDETEEACRAADAWLTSKGYPPVKMAEKSCLTKIVLYVVLPLAPIVVGVVVWYFSTVWQGLVAAVGTALVEAAMLKPVTSDWGD